MTGKSSKPLESPSRRIALGSRAPAFVIVALAALAALVPIGPAAARPAKHEPAVASCASASAQPTRATTAQAELAVLCLLNAERARRGLRELHLNSKLTKAARFQSNDMVDRHYFDHEYPGRPTLVKRIKRTGYLVRAQAWSIGENIAWGTGGYSTPAWLVRAWMGSSGHRENILDPSFRDIGIGIVPGAPADDWQDDGSAATATTDFGKRF